MKKKKKKTPNNSSDQSEYGLGNANGYDGG